jgi:pimeloyl-ACP methyl ester carboxylesterase
VRRLALVAPGGVGREVAWTLRLCALTDTVERIGQPFMGPVTRVAMRWADAAFDVDEARALAWMNAMPGSARALARTVKDVIDWRGQRRHFADRAHEVADLPPIALFWGDRDRVIPHKHATDLVGLVENVEVARFSPCGHFPHRTHADDFATRLGAFLDAESVAPARLVRRPIVQVAETPRSAWRRAWDGICSGVRSAFGLRATAV